MNQPAYHLRPNKAVDRFLLLEVIRRLDQFENLSDYTYFGLGGPYLEDFRVLYEQREEVGMISIESNEHIFKRQKFHLPCRTIQLKHIDIFRFIDQYEHDDQKSIFWLDYTGLRMANFEYFKLLLKKVVERSLVKISLRAEATDWRDNPEGFRRKFQGIMPNPEDNPPLIASSYAKLLQDMLKIVVQRALPGELPTMFQPITSFLYSDSSGILTLTGMVCSREDKSMVREAFDGWPFANLDWSEPKVIDVPILSTKERLCLQDRLPCDGNAGETLFEALGYELEEGEEGKERTKRQLEQYAEFHRYYPYFIRAAP